jgi:hypothetical protein
MNADEPAIDLDPLDPLETVAPAYRALLGDGDVWESPAAGGEDRLIEAILSESLSEPGAVPGRSRSVRPMLLGAVAAAVVLVGGVVVFSAVADPAEPALAVDLVPTGVAGDQGGSIDVVESDSGLRIELEAPGLPDCARGTYYAGWLRTVDDSLVPVGTFYAGSDVVLWAGIAIDEAAAFSVTIESMSPSRATTSGDVVLRGDIP